MRPPRAMRAMHAIQAWSLCTVAWLLLLCAAPAAAITFGDGGVGGLTSTPTRNLTQEDPPAGKALYTNAVSYCIEPRAVLIDAFDIAYWRANHSATFSFSVASIETDLSVRARLYFNAYGIEIFNKEIDICQYVQGVLCPLPQVNVTGFGTYPMPDWVQDQIPDIAWTVPNLEAYARVELINANTNETAACLQATLSNGKTTQQTAVKWASGMFTLVAGLVALFHSMLVNSISPAIYRWFDVLFLYQTAAAAGMMHLNYPLAFSNFVQNFHWSFGLFHSDHMQNSINDMRNRTGGVLSDTAHSDVQYINRKLSPYNVQAMVDFSSLIGNAPKLKSFFVNHAMANPIETVRGGLQRRAPMPSLVDQNQTTDLTTGIPQYVETLGIPYANAYDTIFFFFLAFVAIVLAFHALLALPVFAFSSSSPRNPVTRWATRLRSAYWDFLCANLLRACLVFFFPVFTFAFYQWTIGKKDSGLSIFFGVLGVLFIAVPLCVVFFLCWRRAKRESPEKMGVSLLYTDFHFFQSAGVLYRQFKQKRWFFWFAPYVLAMFARAAFIGFGQRNPWAQVIGCLVVEALLLVSLIVFRPEKRRMGNLLSIVLCIFRLILWGLLIAFLESMHVKPIPRTVIGIVEIAIVGIPTVLLLISLIWNAFYGIIWRRNKTLAVEDGVNLERASFDTDRNEKRGMPAETLATIDSESQESTGPLTPPNETAGYPATTLQPSDSFGKEPESSAGYSSGFDTPSDLYPAQGYPQPPYRPAP